VAEEIVNSHSQVRRDRVTQKVPNAASVANYQWAGNPDAISASTSCAG
jgi:hypothetical protein